MVEQYRVYYYESAGGAPLTIGVMASSEAEATEMADAQVDHDAYVWVHTESEDQYQHELSMLESGGFFGPSGEVYPELHDAHCCDAGYFPF